MSYLINFAYYLDPNGDMSGNPDVHITNDTVTYGNGSRIHGSRSKGPQSCQKSSPANLTIWLPHGYPSNKNSIILAPGNIHAIQDDYREEQMKVFDGPEMAQQLNYKRNV